MRYPRGGHVRHYILQHSVNVDAAFALISGAFPRQADYLPSTSSLTRLGSRRGQVYILLTTGSISLLLSSAR